MLTSLPALLMALGDTCNLSKSRPHGSGIGRIYSRTFGTFGVRKNSPCVNEPPFTTQARRLHYKYSPLDIKHKSWTFQLHLVSCFHWQERVQHVLFTRTRFGSKVVCDNIFPQLRSPSTETAVDYLEEAQDHQQISVLWRMITAYRDKNNCVTSLLTKGNSESKKIVFVSYMQNPSIHIPCMLP
jgi:hypothetical protein